MRLVRVIKQHQGEISTPLTIEKNDIIEGEIRKTNWDGWLWCRNANGVFGWVPEPYLKQLPEDGKYMVIQDYNAFELSVDIGQELLILDKVSSWAWVRTIDHREGWVPLENLEEVSKSSVSLDLDTGT